MRNITVSVDEETYRSAQIRAAELDTSVSALVRDFLKCFAGKSDVAVGLETLDERRRRLLEEVFSALDARGGEFRAADNLSREELYDRDRARTDAAEVARKRPDSTSG